MNGMCWVDCCIIAISELDDSGIDYMTNERTLRRWYTEFRLNEKFNISYVRTALEPKLFSFSPQARKDLIKYCSNKVKTGELCTEGAHSEMTNNIVPTCYSNLLIETSEEMRNSIPTYDDLLQMLDLKQITIHDISLFAGIGMKSCKQTTL